jgi:hypothetical protein
MKLSGGSFVLLCLLTIPFLVLPLLADDMVHPVRTRIYFEKGGQPYNESVSYSIRCYGTFPGSPDRNLSEIYGYSADCPEYGCPVWQPEPRLWLYDIRFCEIQGNTRGGGFTIKNSSLYSSCTPIPPFRTYPPAPWKGSDSYFLTPETQACGYGGVHLDAISLPPRVFFRTCNPDQDPDCFELFNCTAPVKIVSSSTKSINSTYMEDTQYRHYLDTCDPLEDENCPGWFVDGVPLKKTHECRMNTTPLILTTNPCWRFLVQVNRTLVFPPEEWNRHIYQTDEVSRLCYVRWTIPPDNLTLPASPSVSPSHEITTVLDQPVQEVTYGTRAVATARSNNPVETLYCSILRFLGWRCD